MIKLMWKFSPCPIKKPNDSKHLNGGNGKFPTLCLLFGTCLLEAPTTLACACTTGSLLLCWGVTNEKGRNKDCQISVYQIMKTAFFFFPLFPSNRVADRDIYQSQTQCLIKLVVSVTLGGFLLHFIGHSPWNFIGTFIYILCSRVWHLFVIKPYNLGRMKMLYPKQHEKVVFHTVISL